MEILLTRGDIAQQDAEADAIVNAANNHLWMKAGMAMTTNPSRRTDGAA
jgi:O-acetyl-ADP-ribose deacetylase (regulator of RNase III)